MPTIDDAPSAGFPVVTLVCSAGGLEALLAVLPQLPDDFPGAVLVLQHTAPRPDGHLADILDRSSSLPVTFAQDGQRLRPGTVLVAPPGHHLVVGVDDVVRLVRAGAQPPVRPSADLLLVSLAVALGPRVVCAVLTGAGHDASVGAQVVHVYGGRVVVQDQESSRATGMPAAAVAQDDPEAELPIGDLAGYLVDLCSGGDAQVS